MLTDTKTNNAARHAALFVFRTVSNLDDVIVYDLFADYGAVTASLPTRTKNLSLPLALLNHVCYNEAIYVLRGFISLGGHAVGMQCIIINQ